MKVKEIPGTVISLTLNGVNFPIAGEKNMEPAPTLSPAARSTLRPYQADAVSAAKMRSPRTAPKKDPRYEYAVACGVIFPDRDCNIVTFPAPEGEGWIPQPYGRCGGKAGEDTINEFGTDEQRAAIAEFPSVFVAMITLYRRRIPEPERYEIKTAVEFLGGYHGKEV
jgi:hypothetical protein